MITTLRSLCGLGWELKIESNEGSGVIIGNTIQESYSGNDLISAHEIGVIDGIESMALALVCAGIGGYEDRVSHAIDTAIEALTNYY